MRQDRPADRKPPRNSETVTYGTFLSGEGEEREKTCRMTFPVQTGEVGNSPFGFPVSLIVAVRHVRTVFLFGHGFFFFRFLTLHSCTHLSCVED